MEDGVLRDDSERHRNFSPAGRTRVAARRAVAGVDREVPTCGVAHDDQLRGVAAMIGGMGCGPRECASDVGGTLVPGVCARVGQPILHAHDEPALVGEPAQLGTEVVGSPTDPPASVHVDERRSRPVAASAARFVDKGDEFLPSHRGVRDAKVGICGHARSRQQTRRDVHRSAAPTDRRHHRRDDHDGEGHRDRRDDSETRRHPRCDPGPTPEQDHQRHRCADEQQWRDGGDQHCRGQRHERTPGQEREHAHRERGARNDDGDGEQRRVDPSPPGGTVTVAVATPGGLGVLGGFEEGQGRHEGPCAGSMRPLQALSGAVLLAGCTGGVDDRREASPVVRSNARKLRVVGGRNGFPCRPTTQLLFLGPELQPPTVPWQPGCSSASHSTTSPR